MLFLACLDSGRSSAPTTTPNSSFSVAIEIRNIADIIPATAVEELKEMARNDKKLHKAIKELFTQFEQVVPNHYHDLKKAAKNVRKNTFTNNYWHYYSWSLIHRIANMIDPDKKAVFVSLLEQFKKKFPEATFESEYHNYLNIIGTSVLGLDLKTARSFLAREVPGETIRQYLARLFNQSSFEKIKPHTLKFYDTWSYNLVDIDKALDPSHKPALQRTMFEMLIKHKLPEVEDLLKQIPENFNSIDAILSQFDYLWEKIIQQLSAVYFEEFFLTIPNELARQYAEEYSTLGVSESNLERAKTEAYSPPLHTRPYFELQKKYTSEENFLANKKNESKEVLKYIFGDDAENPVGYNLTPEEKDDFRKAIRLILWHLNSLNNDELITTLTYFVKGMLSWPPAQKNMLDDLILNVVTPRINLDLLYPNLTDEQRVDLALKMCIAFTKERFFEELAGDLIAKQKTYGRDRSGKPSEIALIPNLHSTWEKIFYDRALEPFINTATGTKNFSHLPKPDVSQSISTFTRFPGGGQELLHHLFEMLSNPEILHNAIHELFVNPNKILLEKRAQYFKERIAKLEKILEVKFEELKSKSTDFGSRDELRNSEHFQSPTSKSAKPEMPESSSGSSGSSNDVLNTSQIMFDDGQNVKKQKFSALLKHMQQFDNKYFVERLKNKQSEYDKLDLLSHQKGTGTQDRKMKEIEKEFNIIQADSEKSVQFWEKLIENSQKKKEYKIDKSESKIQLENEKAATQRALQTIEDEILSLDARFGKIRPTAQHILSYLREKKMHSLDKLIDFAVNEFEKIQEQIKDYILTDSANNRENLKKHITDVLGEVRLPMEHVGDFSDNLPNFSNYSKGTQLLFKLQELYFFGLNKVPNDLCIEALLSLQEHNEELPESFKSGLAGRWWHALKIYWAIKKQG